MLRSALIAAALALPFAASMPCSAQQEAPPAEQSETGLVGLPVYSSDGEKLGEVMEVGTVAGQRALRAEIGAFLGMGPTPVLIPAAMFQHRTDRIEVAMTAAEVRTSVTSQKNQR